MNYCTDISAILPEAVRDCQWIKKKDRKGDNVDIYEVLNAPCAFDIETTSFDSVVMMNGEADYQSVGTMYEWALGINFKVVYGRTWVEFIDTIEYIVGFLGLSASRRIILYVRNLSFEFQWICKKFKWDSVFAYSERKPIYARASCGIEFRCSYILSGCSLEETGRKLRRETLKKVGDLDYSKMRHSGTPLTQEELGYCEADVMVDMEYIAECIEDEGNITRIPLTKTGYVRRYCRRKCFEKRSDRPYQYHNYKRLMKALTLTIEEYELAKSAFSGGFTHSNVLNTGITHNYVASYDIASSYPTVMVAENGFPMSRGRKVRITNREQFRHYIGHYACIFEVEFVGIRSKTRIDHIISVSKCSITEGAIIDNGRIISADRIRTTVTEVDYSLFTLYYEWDTCRVGDLWYYHRGYLPTPFIEALLKLYGDKTSLKGVDGKEDEYMRAKEMINSAYGMCVTDIIRSDTTYTDEWFVKPADANEQLEHYNTNPMRFISYLWGVYVTAFARRNILSAILATGADGDYIYSDTDSIKLLNYEKHSAYFGIYNNWIDNKCKVAMDHHHLPFELTRPQTKDGKIKPLGHFEFEGVYDQFKTLGAKRYATISGDVFSITVSGVNKKTACPYLIAKYGLDGVMDAFNDGLLIPDHVDIRGVHLVDRKGQPITNPCGKLTHLYIDDEFDGLLTDYTGITAEVHEDSCVNLSPAAYSLGLDETYFNLIMNAHDEQNERI